jgi:hypothetical protein
MLVRLVCPFSYLLPLTHTDEIGNYYFVRFASLSLKDSTNPQYPYQAYSAKFTYVPFNPPILTNTDKTALTRWTVLSTLLSWPPFLPTHLLPPHPHQLPNLYVPSSLQFNKTNSQATSTRASSTVSRPASTAATSNKANGAAATVVSGTLIAGLVGLSAYIAL